MNAVFAEAPVMLLGEDFLLQLPLLLKQVPHPLLLVHPLPASAHGFLVVVAAAAADSSAAAGQLLAAAVVPCDPSCHLAFVGGSWLVLQHPTAGLLAEVVLQLPAEAAVELEEAVVSVGHPVGSH